MRGWAGLIGVSIPFLLLLLASFGPIKGRKLWSLSLFVNLISWACFVFLTAAFYTKEIGESGSIFSPLIIGKNPWTGDLSFRWDFQSAVISLAASTVVVSYHFLARRTLELSRSSVAAICSYLGCLLGALGAGHLFLFSIFFAGSLVPRFVFTGVSVRENGINAVRETAFLGIVALFSLIIVVLGFSEPFRGSLSTWFQFSGGNRVILPGAIGFSLLLFAAAIGAGIFPFHGNSRKSYEMDSIERSVPLALQPLFGFTILFRFSVDLFSTEFQTFGPFLLGLFSLGLFYCAICFLGSKSSRDRVFWLQQAMTSLVAIGFFSLNRKGWHGGSVLLLFQSLAIPFLLIVLSCHERRPPLAINRITEFPAFALSTVSAVLFALFLPVSIGFYGVLLVVWSLVPTQAWFLYFVIISIPIIALAGIKSMFFQMGEPPKEIPTSAFRDLTYEEILAILPIGALLLFLGLMPKILMGPIGVSATALLQGMGIKN